MATTSEDVDFRSHDGHRLRGSLVKPAEPSRAVTVFVHGGGATLLDYVDSTVSKPDVLMVRCGLTVSHHALAAAEALIGRLRPREVRGMAPFGGTASDPIWKNVDPALFLTPESRGVSPDRFQAALAVAFATPRVSAVAVGTSQTGHLAQLCEASALNADPETITRYRSLLAERHRLSTRTDSDAGKRLSS